MNSLALLPDEVGVEEELWSPETSAANLPRGDPLYAHHTHTL